MKNAARSLTAACMLVLSQALPTLAHPGHGSPAVDPNGLLHYLLEPVHLIALLALGVLLTLLNRKRAMRRCRRATSWVWPKRTGR